MATNDPQAVVQPDPSSRPVGQPSYEISSDPNLADAEVGEFIRASKIYARYLDENPKYLGFTAPAPPPSDYRHYVLTIRNGELPFTFHDIGNGVIANVKEVPHDSCPDRFAMQKVYLLSRIPGVRVERFMDYELKDFIADKRTKWNNDESCDAIAAALWNAAVDAALETPAPGADPKVPMRMSPYYGPLGGLWEDRSKILRIEMKYKQVDFNFKG